MPDDDILMFERLVTFGEGTPSLDDRVAYLQEVRRCPGEVSRRADLRLLGRIQALTEGLQQAGVAQDELRRILEKLGATPWHPAVFLRAVQTGVGPRALVVHGSSRRLVGVADGVDLEGLQAGDEVFLGGELNVIVAVSPLGLSPGGETACYDRSMPDGRLVLKWRDEEVVVDVAAALASVELQRGDMVRWDRSVVDGPGEGAAAGGAAGTSSRTWPTSAATRWAGRSRRSTGCSAR